MIKCFIIAGQLWVSGFNGDGRMIMPVGFNVDNGWIIAYSRVGKHMAMKLPDEYQNRTADEIVMECVNNIGK